MRPPSSFQKDCFFQNRPRAFPEKVDTCIEDIKDGKRSKLLKTSRFTQTVDAFKCVNLIAICSKTGLKNAILSGIQSFLLLALSFPTHAATLTDRVHTLNPPQKIPAFVFTDAANAQHALTDYRGSFILLNIWATWCAPCTHEMPSLDALQKQFDPKKLRVITLSEDRGDAVVTGFYKTHAITNLPVAIDSAGTAPAVFHLNGLPTTFLIDPQGFAIARLEGEADWSSPQALDFLRQKIK